MYRLRQSLAICGKVNVQTALPESKLFMSNLALATVPRSTLLDVLPTNSLGALGVQFAAKSPGLREALLPQG